MALYCPECRQRFSSDEEASAHVAEVHGDREPDEGDPIHDWLDSTIDESERSGS